MAPQGSTSESIFQYQKPSLSVHMPKIRYVQRKKGIWREQALGSICPVWGWLPGFPSGTPEGVLPLLYEQISLSPEPAWAATEVTCQGHHLTGWGCDPLLKQILQVNLIDQLFSLLLPLPKLLQLFPNSPYWLSDNKRHYSEIMMKQQIRKQECQISNTNSHPTPP